MKENNDLNVALQIFVDSFTKKNGIPPTIDQINYFLHNLAESMNNAPRDNFDGLSSLQMHKLFDLLWSSDSPIILNELTQEEYMQIPLLRQVLRLTEILVESGKIKLTLRGALPTTIVRQIYSVGTPDRFIEEYKTERLIEDDSKTVQRTNIILKILGVTKTQKGIITLTVRGKRLIKDKHQLLSELLKAFTYSFNWAYFDCYENEDVGQRGAGFSLLMVSKYGREWKRDNFYAQKYFAAFPIFEKEKGWREEFPGENCYIVRTFERFMLELGLIEIQEEKIKNDKDSHESFYIHQYIRKTELFDKMLTFKL